MTNKMVQTLPIADLHCDLLTYLCRGAPCTPYDPVVRCSIPQLRQGGVRLQTMAIFTLTEPGSSQQGLSQAQLFKTLPKAYPDDFFFVRESDDVKHLLETNKIAICLAVENSSSFAEEDDDLETALALLLRFHKNMGRLLYVSLTWNDENRFGGGAHTSIGLKQDGRRLLDFLSQHRIAVDLSHASDRLAYDIFEHIEKQRLPLKVIASHSVMRQIHEVPRNLPDPIAQEIIRRGGVIGLNWIAKFIGPRMDYFLKHLDRLLLMGGAEHVCFGADFFYEDDVPAAHRTAGTFFFPDFGDASRYPRLLQMIRQELHLPEEVLSRLAYGNFLNFVQKN